MGSYLRDIEENESIEVLTETTVEKVLGYFGNFVVTVNSGDSDNGSREFNVGAILAAAGMNFYSPETLKDYGYGQIGEVYTALEFEAMNKSGTIAMKNGKKPESVGIIHCVGRTEKGYCSRVCCMVSMKIARYLQEKAPGCAATGFYRDLSIPGSGAQSFYEKTQAGGACYICSDKVELSESNGKVRVAYTGDNSGTEEFDMVVLLPSIEPAVDAAELAEMLNIEAGSKGFLTEEHEIIGPVNTSIQGIYLSGCISGPRGISETVAQSEAAAGKILSTLVPGRKLETEAKTSHISEHLCVGCRTCMTVCCYSAIEYDETKGICVVNEVLCKGCGNCASACPSGAAVHQHFTAKQIYREMLEILR